MAIIVLAIMGGLALKAWRPANAEKAASERATQAAESKHKADEDLLREAGRTKAALNRLVETQSKVEALLEALTPLVGDKSGKLILERAEDVVRSVSSQTGDDPRVILGLAGLRRVCGRLYLRLGNDETALKQAQEARRLVEAQLKINNADPALKKQLHDCLLLIGDAILGGRGPDTAKRKTDEDYSRAVAAYHEGLELARTESMNHPEDSAWRDLYFSDLINLGETAELFRPGKVKEAEAQYKNALKMLAEVRQRVPAAADLNSIEASIHDRLGTLFLELGRTAEARNQFDLSLSLRQPASNEELAKEPERQSDLATTYNKLGNFFKYQGQFKEASDYERSLTIRRKLCEQNKQRDWQRNLGFTLYNVSYVQWRLGEKSKNSTMKARAIELSQERLKLADTLLVENPSDPDLKLDYAHALYAYADLLLNVSDNTLKDWPRALELAREAVSRTDRRDPWSLVLLAQALRFAKRPDEALKVAEEASKLLPPEEKRTSDEKEVAKEIAYELSKDKNTNAGEIPPHERRRRGP